MKKILLSIPFLLAHALSAQYFKPSLTAHIPFQLVSHAQTKLDSDKTYIIGCSISTSDINIGVFELINQKPHLALEIKSKSKDLYEIDQDFTKYFATIITELENHYGITIKLACLASPGNTNATKDYIKHHHFFAIDGREIKQQTNIEQIFVVNDFEVVGYGIAAIDQKNIITLQEGKPRARGTKLIVGAGNGLGTGLMLWNDKLDSYVPSPISWSFVEFSPQTELELKLNTYLQKETGSRSWGKVLGAHGGVLRLYDFLNLSKLYDTAPVKYNQFQEVFDHAKTDTRCKDAVELYVHLYARLLRNVIYAQLPYNGVYITNAVAEKNPELIKNPSFLKEILNTENDYLSNYFSEIPIYLVKEDPTLSMYGAALYGLVYRTQQPTDKATQTV